MPNTSCSTKASRSAGSSVSRTTSSEPDCVRPYCVGLRVSFGGSNHGIGNVHIQEILPTGSPRPQHVQTHARDDGREPGAQVLDVADIGPAESNPAFLDRILGFARRPEHPIRHGPQMRAVLFELLGQRLGYRHPVTFLPCGPSW